MAAPWQEVITLPLPPSLRNALNSAGFRTVADLLGVGPVDLSTGVVDHANTTERTLTCVVSYRHDLQNSASVLTMPY